MNITKHGAESKEELMTEEFECKRCGCKFTADDDEFYVEKGTCFTTSVSLTYMYSAKVTDIYVCSCPECHKIVTKTKERINENPCITLTSNNKTEYASSTGKTKSSRTESPSVVTWKEETYELEAGGKGGIETYRGT